MKTEENKVNIITGKEFADMQQNELTDQELIGEFLSRFNFEYYKDGGYRPLNESSYKKGCPHINGYYTHYSFPHGSNTPIASFWTKSPGEEEKFQIFHIDLHRFTKEFIKHIERQGYTSPPPKEQFTSNNRNFNEDKKPY